jgi:hypothetical protein
VRNTDRTRKDSQVRDSRPSILRTSDARLVALALCAALAAAAFLSGRTAATAAGDPSAEPGAGAAATQRRRPSRRAPQRRRPARDLSKFSHGTAGHYENCAACHKVPAMSRRAEAADYLSGTDIEDFPDHDSCLDCHRQRHAPRFFQGARPVICAVCHKGAITPRNDARFDFPKPNARSQFDGVFPHDAHFKGTSLPRFKRLLGDKSKPQDSCAYCHKPNPAVLKVTLATAASSAAAGATTAAAQSPAAAAPAEFEAKPGAFMTTPSGHASCFECHWQEGVDGRDFKPLANDCAQCHRNLALPTPKPSAAAPRPASATSSPAPAARFVTAALGPAPPAARPAAFVRAAVSDDDNPLAARHAAPKFPHEIEAHKCRDKVEEKDRVEKEGPCRDRVAVTCLSCHTTVRKVKTLEDLRGNKQNWVQLPSCSSSACHTALSGSGPLKLSLFRELQGRRRDPTFDCAYCHLPPLSTGPEVPRSHYAAVYDSAAKELSAAKAKGDEAEIKRRQDALNRVKAAIPDQFKDVIKE